ERDERVRALVRREDERAAPVEREVTRRAPAGRLVADERQLLGRGVEGVDDDAVVAAIRAVDESAIRMDVDVGGEVGRGAGDAPGRGIDLDVRGEGGSDEVARDRRDRLDWLEPAPLGVVAEGGEAGADLVDHENVAAARVKGEVPRPGAGRGGGERR